MKNLSFTFGYSRFLGLTAVALLWAESFPGAMATTSSPNGSKPLNKCIVGAA